VWSFANQKANGNDVVDLASVVGKPLRMHMLLGSPVVVSVEGS
jgi:hypothetical protein